MRGLVQGVGFRPTVWRIAHDLGLRGEVLNDASGVLVRLWGDPAALAGFLPRLRAESPPLARIDGAESTPIPGPGPAEFRIVESRSGEVRTGVVPDAATCPACRAETLDPADRRYRYPFTNCTHCGPRLSILRAIPYDRPNTSMAPFVMCPACAAEYGDPADRRFHAQPNACAACGPKVWLEDAAGNRVEDWSPALGPDVQAPAPRRGLQGEDTVRLAAALIRAGRILAIKGIGGVHLACDACNEAAVAELRRRKNRYRKPLALMARDIGMIRRWCRVEDAEVELLQSPAAPVVILELRDAISRRDGISEEGPAPSIAPGQRTLGFMLPYTPLHHLLMQELDRPIVLTSGNLSEEPQCTGNAESRERLGRIADFLLLHDREIVNRVDDSVARIMDGAPQLLRRARGYAPAPILLHAGFAAAPPLLAIGGELKNTFCLLQEGRATLSQHLGDLAETTSFRAFRETLALYRDIFRHEPEMVAVDLHPGYLSARHGRELAAELGCPLVEVQHHHAHVAAVMAEHGLPPDTPPLLGIALDGLGYGSDGTLWGCELLLADFRSFERLATLRPARLLGGDQASREPWRNLYARLAELPEAELEPFRDLPLFEFLHRQPRQVLDRMLERGLNSPLSSSAGRLFDAVAAALEICRERADYEGEAAIELEQAMTADPMEELVGYPFGLMRSGLQSDQRGQSGPLWEIDPRPLWPALLTDLKEGRKRAMIAARFHAGFADALVETASAVCSERGVGRVALSGGVFQNRLLFECVGRRLRAAGLETLTHRLVPANDGGIALGQAAVVAARFGRPSPIPG